MQPSFDLIKIIYSTDEATVAKARKLYESGAIRHFREMGYMFRATVHGTHPYDVSISAKNPSVGDCDCYMGQQDYVCKHMVALAIHSILRGQPFPVSSTKIVTTPTCSGKIGELSPSELFAYQEDLKVAIRYIKAYSGPSRTWFAYQDSLSEGTRRLSALVSYLPVSLSSAKLLVKLLIRLDKKLTIGGVDDSDGTVGNFIEQCVDLLLTFAQLDPKCHQAFNKLAGLETSFGWEERLVSLQSPKLPYESHVSSH